MMQARFALSARLLLEVEVSEDGWRVVRAAIWSQAGGDGANLCVEVGVVEKGDGDSRGGRVFSRRIGDAVKV